MRRFLKRFLAFSAIGILLEIGLRLFPSTALAYRLADKKLHCFDSEFGAIFLCPSQDLNLQKETFHYHIRTNASGERLIDQREIQSDLPEVWIIGDSIAMGYGIDDELSAPYLLAAQIKHPVKNLGVDALGIEGTRSRLAKALKQSSPRRPPLVYYIFNQSEFIDYPRELGIKNSVIRRITFQIQFFFSKSAIVSWLRTLLEKDRVSYDPNTIQAPAPPPSQDDPVFQSLLSLVKDCESIGSKLTIIFYLDGNPDGKQSELQPYQEPAKIFAMKHGIRVLDLRGEFKKQATDGLYIQDDGHPSYKSAKIFASGIERDLVMRVKE